jgi:hypothetical protein
MGHFTDVLPQREMGNVDHDYYAQEEHDGRESRPEKCF